MSSIYVTFGWTVIAFVLIHWYIGSQEFVHSNQASDCVSVCVLRFSFQSAFSRQHKPTDQPTNQAANHRTNDLKKKRADGYGRCDRNLMLIEYSGN